MAPSGSIWHKESLKLKEIFGTREGFEICPNNFSPRPNFSPPGTQGKHSKRGLHSFMFHATKIQVCSLGSGGGVSKRFTRPPLALLDPNPMTGGLVESNSMTAGLVHPNLISQGTAAALHSFCTQGRLFNPKGDISCTAQFTDRLPLCLLEDVCCWYGREEVNA